MLFLLRVPAKFENRECQTLLYDIFQNGLTAIHVAAEYGQAEIVQDMLQKVAGSIPSEVCVSSYQIILPSCKLFDSASRRCLPSAYN